MTTRTIDCIECGTAVPYGRLSCPACGALLASVTGGPAHVVTEPVPESDPEPPLLMSDDESTAGPVPPLEAPEPVLVGRPYAHASLDDPSHAASLAPPPSGYRPSQLSLSGAVAAADATSTPMSAATVQTRIGPVDPTRLAEIAGWFAVVGATMAVLGFVLPWSSVVIGARSASSYFDTWGLASVTHIPVLAAAMIVLALAVMQTSVPVWIRSGVLPLGLGGLLIGLAWPYQIGPLGADVGITVVVLGGLTLAIGGVVGCWATRHVEPELSV